MPPLKVLVVEDDLACLELMTEVFTSLKAEVRAVGKSEKAAAMVNQEKFDGIFLDLEMPTLSGFDLARLIRKSSWNKSTPIVIVTGSDERKTMQDAFAIGATFFIQKPVDRQKLSVLFRTVSGGMLENRRKYTRVPIQAVVSCIVGSRTVCGMSWNLSMGGMQVEVGDLKAKDTVRLSFQLPTSGAAIDAEGVVVWANENRQGVQFMRVSEQSQQSIRQFMTEVENMDR
ncbi:MAG: response regulator [Candidatus Sulfotelmatobacter sp.]|jgi:CheY-like chemotaxis protein